MKFIKNETPLFSMEDFEKGLMLAGLILPSNIAELNEKTELEKYEKQLQQEKKQVYFKRAVLAAEIASELYNEPTFGRIKFQKLVYLCEYAADMNLQTHYKKQAAGPFDNKFMHAIEAEFKKQKWFEVQKKSEGGITRSIYIPLQNQIQYKKYFISYFGICSERLKYVIDLFRKLKTDETEISATVFSCYKEIKANNEIVSENRLLELFYSWSEEKKRFDKERVLKNWKWLIDKGIINDDYNIPF